MKAIIIANGNISDYDYIGKAALGLGNGAASFIICCDGGAIHARKMGIIPDVIVGDLDSIDADTREYYEKAGIRFEKYPAEKDCSDAEIALEKAAQMGAEEIVFIGATGERADHTLSNIGILYNCFKRGIKAEIIDDNNTISLIDGKTALNVKPGQTVSLLPFTEEATGITTQGLYYPLCDESLHWGTTRGVSNVCVSENVSVDLKSGLLLIVIPNRP